MTKLPFFPHSKSLFGDVDTEKNMNNKQNEEYKKKRNERRIMLLIGFLIIGGLILFNLDTFMWAFGIEKKTSIVFDEDESAEVLSEDTAMDSSIIVLDTIRPNNSKDVAKKSSQSSRYNSSPSYSSDDDELNNDPEYREGGKYDPAKYHTDYGKDQEERRRRYIDNDGFDDDDGYDEYRGYEHENERSAQWDD